MAKDRELGEPTCEALKRFPSPFFEQDDEDNDKGCDRFDDSDKKFHESPLCRKDTIDEERYRFFLIMSTDRSIFFTFFVIL